MADVDVNMNVAEDVAIVLDAKSDIAVSLNPASDVTINIPSDISASPSFNAQYQAVYDSYTTKPDAATAAIWNTFVATLVASGEWAVWDALWVHAAHTNGAGEALKNWMLPGTYNATIFNAPLFTISEGFTGNAIDTRIDYNFNLNTHGVNYTLNSGAVCAYARVAAANTSYLMGARTGNRTWFSPDAGATSKIGVNGGNINGTAMATDGMFFVTRYDGSNFKVFRNKVEIQDVASAAVALPNTDLLGLCYSNAGVPTSFSNNQLSMLAIGPNATQANVNNITNAFETAMDALGTGVIP